MLTVGWHFQQQQKQPQQQQKQQQHQQLQKQGQRRALSVHKRFFLQKYELAGNSPFPCDVRKSGDIRKIS